MASMTTLPFRAARKFTLAGQVVQPGDVVDIGVCSIQRVKQLEDAGYGIRVAKDEQVTSRGTAAKSKSSAARSSRSSPPPRRRAGTSSKG